MSRTLFRWIVPGAVLLACLTLWPAEAAAQRRAVRRPVARPATVVYARPYYRPYYRTYVGAYFAPYYWGSWYGWGGWGWGYQYPYPPYYRPYAYYDPTADLRIQVTPRDAEVYLDGYLVGTVDNFDGVFQRLRVPYGEHEVEIYFQGYQTIRQKMLFRPGESYRIREVMQPLGSGQQAEPRPTPSSPPPDRRERLPVRGAEPPEPAGAVPEERTISGDFGTLTIRVQPEGAEIIVDGERWETPTGEERLTLDLNEGTHKVEIRKEGHKTYSADVQIRRGRTQMLNVSLPKGNEL